MEKGKSFFKRFQFMLLVILLGGVFFTVFDRWDLYEKPVTGLGRELQSFLGLEGTWAHEEAPLDDLRAKDGANEETSSHDGQPGQAGEDAQGDGGGEYAPDAREDGEEAPSGPPEFVTVDETYFDDALFIGDSRVVGLRDYGRLKDHATFYAYEGLNIFRLLSAKIVEVAGQRKKISVEEALGQNQFGKIYLMVGINELDIGTVERYENTYREVVDRIRELQPNAKIFIQSILPVTQKRAAKGDFVTNDGIFERNEALKRLSDDETVFYLDVAEAVTDESGGMDPAYTSDGIHLKAKYVPLWTEYLKTHALAGT